MANELNTSINTSCIITPVKQITKEYSSSSRDTTLCPDSPDTMFNKFNKSPVSLRRYDVVERGGSHCSSLTFSKFFHYLLSFSYKGLLFYISLANIIIVLFLESTGTENSSSKENSISDSSAQSLFRGGFLSNTLNFFIFF